MQPAAATMHATTLRIPRDHPSLPGHFPGQPMVPGVVLLDRVIDAAAAWLGRPIAVRSLPRVKFVAPLLPDEQAQLELKRQGAELRFVIRRDDTLIAQGTLGMDVAGAAI